MPTIIVDGKEVDIEQLKNDWALALMSQGIIVRLFVSRWRATTRLTPESLGLKFVDGKGYDFMNKYIELGKQKLLPPAVLEEIQYLENMARKNLDNFSFDTVWGKFVPFRVFKDWEQENERIRGDFMEQARVLGEKYNSMVTSVKEEYRIMAKDVWYRLYPDKGDPAPSFVEEFASKVVAKIPSQIDIISSFKYDATYFIIPMPSFIQDDIARAEKIKNQASVDKFNSELEVQTKQIISDQYIKRKKELIDDFLESTVYNLRKYVSELCDAVLQSMKQKSATDSLSNTQITKLKKMMQKVKVLNFYDDAEISTLLKGLDSELDKIKGETNNDVIMHKLEEIVEVSKKEYIPTSFDSTISYLDI